MTANDTKRVYREALAQRVETGEDLKIMTVTFARYGVFNRVWSKWQGEFLERIMPGSFAKTFEKGSQIRCLFQHGLDPNVGQKPLGAILSLGDEPEGPTGKVALFDTDYVNELLPGLEAEPPVFGTSYNFKAVSDTWERNPPKSAHNPEGIPERTLTEVEMLEFGPVTFPADPGTDGLIRVGSLTDYFNSDPAVDGEAPGAAPASVGVNNADRAAEAFGIASRARRIV